MEGFKMGVSFWWTLYELSTFNFYSYLQFIQVRQQIRTMDTKMFFNAFGEVNLKKFRIRCTTFNMQKFGWVWIVHPFWK